MVKWGEESSDHSLLGNIISHDIGLAFLHKSGLLSDNWYNLDVKFTLWDVPYIFLKTNHCVAATTQLR